MRTEHVLLETTPAAEIHFDGLAECVIVGSNVWFLLYQDQPSVEHPGTIERILVARCVAPLENVPRAVEQVLRTIGRNAMCRGWATAGKVFAS